MYIHLDLVESLLDPVRCFHAERFSELSRDDCDIRRFILRLAADGLFWLEMFQCYRPPSQVRQRMVALMEDLARQWSVDYCGQSPVSAGLSSADVAATPCMASAQKVSSHMRQKKIISARKKLNKTSAAAVTSSVKMSAKKSAAAKPSSKKLAK